MIFDPAVKIVNVNTDGGGSLMGIMVRTDAPCSVKFNSPLPLPIEYVLATLSDSVRNCKTSLATVDARCLSDLLDFIEARRDLW